MVGLDFLDCQGPETGGPVNDMYSNWNNDPSEPNQAGARTMLTLQTIVLALLVHGMILQILVHH